MESYLELIVVLKVGLPKHKASNLVHIARLPTEALDIVGQYSYQEFSPRNAVTKRLPADQGINNGPAS